MHSTLDLDEALPSEYREMMASYLEKAHMHDIVAILLEMDSSSAKHYAIAISVLDLLHENSALGALLLHYPIVLLPYFDEAIGTIQERVIVHHEERLFMTVKPSCHARLHRLPCCPELCKPTVTSIRAVSVHAACSGRGLRVV